MDVWIAWLVGSFLVAGGIAAYTRDRRRRVAALIIVPLASVGLLAAAFFAAGKSLSPVLYVLIVLTVTAVVAALTPGRGRIAVVAAIPALGVVLFLVLRGLLVACCGT